MQIEPIKTHRIEPGESLESVFDRHLTDLQDGDILVVTSKIVSLAQNRLVKKDEIAKYDLIRREADLVLDTPVNPYDLYLTIKDNMLVPSAGIDESNIADGYILLPEDSHQAACDIWTYLRHKHAIETLGVIVSDSHTTIMRRGVTGIALGWCGFIPLHSYIGSPDLFDKPLRVTQINILDALATSAVFVMGEGSEQTPMALIRHAPKIVFVDRPPSGDERHSIAIPMDEDLYGPILQAAKWVQKDRP